tara:strand:- start:31 stop:222 length:192 start_codon:yes stop_codon:yes gene_type:complete
MRRKKTLDREKDIIEFCSNEKKHISEIVEKFNMNIHTLRSKYIYSLVKENKLKKLGGRWYISN